MRKQLFALVILLLATTYATGAVQSADDYELTWTIIESGGAMAGEDYSLVNTIGQPEVGSTQNGGGYSLNGGVLNDGAAGPIPPSEERVYLPMILR